MGASMQKWLLAGLAIVSATYARVVQDDFVHPSLPDESVTIVAGSTYTIEWTGQLYSWFTTYAASANVTNVDLILTGTDNANYVHLVRAGVDVTKTRTVSWKVSLPDNELSDTPYYTFRFIRGGSTYSGPDGEQISSPQIVIRAAVSTSTSSSASSTSTTASATSATSATITPSGPSQPQSDQRKRKSGLSGGAIAGIVIGTILGVAFIIGLLWFLVRKSRKSLTPQQEPMIPSPGIAGKPPVQPNSHHGYYEPKTTHSDLHEPSELPPPSYGNPQVSQSYSELPAEPNQVQPVQLP